MIYSVIFLEQIFSVLSKGLLFPQSNCPPGLSEFRLFTLYLKLLWISSYLVIHFLLGCSILTTQKIFSTRGCYFPIIIGPLSMIIHKINRNCMSAICKNMILLRISSLNFLFVLCHKN